MHLLQRAHGALARGGSALDVDHHRLGLGRQQAVAFLFHGLANMRLDQIADDFAAVLVAHQSGHQ